MNEDCGHSAEDHAAIGVRMMHTVGAILAREMYLLEDDELDVERFCPHCLLGALVDFTAAAFYRHGIDPMDEAERESALIAADAVATAKFDYYHDLFHGRRGEYRCEPGGDGEELHSWDAVWDVVLDGSDDMLRVTVHLGQDVPEIVEAELSGRPITEAQITEVLLGEHQHHGR